MTNDKRNTQNCEYSITTLPAWVRCRPNISDRPERCPEGMVRWSGGDDPPAIGEHIVTVTRGRGEESMQVISYFVEHGWLGVECLPLEFQRAVLAFGIDLRDAPGTPPRCSCDPIAPKHSTHRDEMSGYLICSNCQGRIC